MHPALFHQSDETIEQVTDVVRAGTRLGMPLEAERRPIGAAKTLQAAIEQGDMSHLHVFGQGCSVYGESVILAGDHHAPGFNVLHRMICTMMAEFHLDRPRATGKAQQLVAQADAKRRYACINQFANGPNCVVAGLRIAWTIGEKNPVWL